MEMDAWYKWMLVYFYDGGGILLFLACSVLAFKLRSLSSFIAAIGILCFVVGNYGQTSSHGMYVEARQTLQDQSGIIASFYIWRIMSSTGFILGCASLLWTVVKSKGSFHGRRFGYIKRRKTPT